MIITWLSELDGQTGFFAEPGDYDGAPYISNLWMDCGPTDRHWDRQAIAAYLVFGRTFGGPVHMPHKFSPAVANAMKVIATPVQLDLQPIEYHAKRLPIGERKLILVRNNPIPERLLDPENQMESYLEVLPSDKASGAIRRINGLTVASNAWLHVSADGLASWYPFIAMACLFAEDLDAGTIVVPDEIDTSTQEWKNLHYLLSTARLGLEIGL
ncbi:hypothetical protein Q2T94_16945 [Paeniglutamicibacter sulfureus]|uniref:hypothetical protein n=1 Tax=Paeniglutamicibacter sulfureus TaxID=43666 RepID=UPI00266610D4|nr:hypothetical protein [Paeniglutamicibacter sulfureus]MDO2935989.1 hypothetical protein [Paeniglutamicibacter sulfureus]